MIDILIDSENKHGGCMECGPDDRADDIYVFQLGSFTIRVCSQHGRQLEEALGKASRKLSWRILLEAAGAFED